MKKIQQKIQKLAKLARLKLDKNEVEEMVLDFDKMLGFINKLDEVNVNDVQPLIHIHNIKNNYRDDKVLQSTIKKDLLNSAPEKNSDYFKVPKVNSKN